MRVCAIDYGDARTGLAVSDPTGLLAGHTETVQAYRAEAVAARIDAVAREYGAGKLVLGYPLNMDGSRGPRAEKAEAFAELLRNVTGLPVTLWDERRTTVDAHRILRANGKNGGKRKKVVDAVAAALILEGYLAWERGQAEASAQSGPVPETSGQSGPVSDMSAQNGQADPSTDSGRAPGTPSEEA